jgi:hypothetical protein
MIVLEQLKLLVNLARIDGEMASKEREYIINIGKAHGFPESSVETLFYGSHESIIPDNLSADQRFNYLFIKFCATIATKLGYQSQVMFELLLKVKSGDMDQKEVDSLKELTIKYLTNA